SSAGEKRMWAISIALAIATIAWFEWGSVSSSASGVHANVDDKSIAVLPFSDLSAEGDQVYFGDGMAEEILNLLAKNPELRVAGRTSSFKFRGEETDLRNIGDALNVAHVLEGSVRKAGLQVRVTAQLIDTESGFHLWSETYDTELDNIFDVQDRISASIVEALEATIGGDTKTSRAAPTDNLDAYSLYLRAKPLVVARGKANLASAIHLLESALLLDPEFNEAKETLAFAYGISMYWGSDIDRDARFARARELNDQALAANPDSPRAWLSDAVYRIFYGGDWNGMRESLVRAYAINPRLPDTANFIGDYYRITGNVEKAIQYEGLAVDLDPLSAVNHHDYADALLIGGRLDDAVAEYERGLELDETLDVRTTGVLLYLTRKDFARARLNAEWNARQYGENAAVYLRDYEAQKTLMWGTLDDLREHVPVLEADLGKIENPFAVIVDVYLALGECDKASEVMQKYDITSRVNLRSPYSIVGAGQCPNSESWQQLWSEPSLKLLSELRAENGIHDHNLLRRVP
ncbi:MAG: hypothetical protein R3270_12115, partial [Gammaproteobacteria bacterium]|nr:hypothetical protein [Gammaproteobacteria bacterium]